jgi:hypothetical protein
MEREVQITLVLFASFVIFVIVHNIPIDIYGREQGWFYTLSLISLAGFIASGAYSIAAYVKSRKE